MCEIQLVEHFFRLEHTTEHDPYIFHLYKTLTYYAVMLFEYDQLSTKEKISNILS